MAPSIMFTGPLVSLEMNSIKDLRLFLHEYHSTGYVWYYSFASFTLMKLTCNTRQVCHFFQKKAAMFLPDPVQLI